MIIYGNGGILCRNKTRADHWFTFSPQVGVKQVSKNSRKYILALGSSPTVAQRVNAALGFSCQAKHQGQSSPAGHGSPIWQSPSSQQEGQDRAGCPQFIPRRRMGCVSRAASGTPQDAALGSAAFASPVPTQQMAALKLDYRNSIS